LIGHIRSGNGGLVSHAFSDGSHKGCPCPVSTERGRWNLVISEVHPPFAPVTDWADQEMTPLIGRVTVAESPVRKPLLSQSEAKTRETTHEFTDPLG
jgi:hypothetical protein